MQKDRNMSIVSAGKASIDRIIKSMSMATGLRFEAFVVSVPNDKAAREAAFAFVVSQVAEKLGIDLNDERP